MKLVSSFAPQKQRYFRGAKGDYRPVICSNDPNWTAPRSGESTAKYSPGGKRREGFCSRSIENSDVCNGPLERPQSRSDIRR